LFYISISGCSHFHENHYAPAEYEFGYVVHDEHTGDIKHQKESRDGDKVEGEYSFIEPDGYRRTVRYSADKHTGFTARVYREKVEGYTQPGFSHLQASYAQLVNYNNDQKKFQYLN
jgi:hypothetical protein